MRAWQLYLDESGDFEEPKETILVAGVLFEGRATQQSSSAVRRRIEEIFVGSDYPPHAAHHNVATSLLCGMLADRKPEGPAAPRFLRGVERALAVARGRSPAAQRLRSALANEPWKRQIEHLRIFEEWLGRAEPDAHRTLVEERNRQRGDLTRYGSTGLALHLGSPPFVVAAWQAEASDTTRADARYERLYEILLERALSFIARTDADAQIHVHLGARSLSTPQQVAAGLNEAQERARRFPLLACAESRLLVVRYNPRPYDRAVDPGIVLADFASNTLRRTLRPGTSWESAAKNARDLLGLPISATSAILPLASALPGVAADGPCRDAIRRAAEGVPIAPVSGAPSRDAISRGAEGVPGTVAPAEPRWAREQAQAWIAALRGEAAP